MLEVMAMHQLSLMLLFLEAMATHQLSSLSLEAMATYQLPTLFLEVMDFSSTCWPFIIQPDGFHRLLLFAFPHAQEIFLEVLVLALLKYPFYPLFILDNGMNLISKSLTPA